MFFEKYAPLTKVALLIVEHFSLLLFHLLCFEAGAHKENHESDEEMEEVDEASLIMHHSCIGMSCYLCLNPSFSSGQCVFYSQHVDSNQFLGRLMVAWARPLLHSVPMEP